MRRTMTTMLIFTMLVTLPGIALAAAGDLDTSFGTGGSTTPISSAPSDVVLQSDGKIVGLGSDALARWTFDGNLDTSFGSSGTVPQYRATQLAVQHGGSADHLLVGYYDRVRINCCDWVNVAVGVRRYTPSGALDQTFSANLAFPEGEEPNPIDLEVQPDGGVIQAVTVRQITLDMCVIVECVADPRQWHMLVRYRPDGGLDETFGDGGIVLLERQAFGSTWWKSLDVEVQSDGRLVIASLVTDGVFVRRLQPDGSADPTFAPTTILAPLAHRPQDPALAIDGDGDIILAGGACPTIYYDETGCETQIRRLQSNGLPDPSFTEVKMIGARLQELEVDATGAVLVIDRQRMTRLTPSGDIDETFGSNGSIAIADLQAAVAQSDLKVVALHRIGNYPAYEMVVSRYLGSAEATEPPPPVTTGTIAGSVTTTSGTPIAGAVVDCGTGGSSTSSSSGEYWITDVPEGSHHCTASASGYRSKKQHVTVVAGETRTANFQLHPGRNP